MLKKPLPRQSELEMVTLESLVPSDPRLRKIDAVVDFSFIHDRVSGLYCPDNGRPALDPVVMFKALFVGYLLGVHSERQLVREIEVNLEGRGILGVTGYRRPTPPKPGMMARKAFAYQPEADG